MPEQDAPWTTGVARGTNVDDEGFSDVAPGERPRRLLDGVLGAPTWSQDGDRTVVALFDGIEPGGVWFATGNGTEVPRSATPR